MEVLLKELWFITLGNVPKKRGLGTPVSTPCQGVQLCLTATLSPLVGCHQCRSEEGVQAAVTATPPGQERRPKCR